MADNYVPPEGDKLKLTFSGEYIIPDGDKITLDFAKQGGGGPAVESYIFPIGYNTNLFGSIVIFQQQFIRPLGFIEVKWGSPKLHNLRQIATVNGIPAPPVPSPTVISKNRYVRPTGQVFSIVEKPRVWNQRTVITGKGYVATLWGDNVIWNRNHEARDVSAGEQTLFGKHRAYNSVQKIAPRGVDSLVFAYPNVRNKTPQIDVKGATHTAFGVHTLSNVRNVVYPKSFGSDEHGRPTIANRTKEIKGPYPWVYPNTWGIGTPYVRGGKKTIFVKAGPNELWGETKIQLGTFTQIIEPKGFDNLKFGDIVMSPRTISTLGFKSGWFGTPSLIRPVLVPTSIASNMRFGLPRVYENPWYVHAPTLGDSLEVGTPTIRDALTKVYTHSDLNIVDTFGIARIYNFNRYIYPVGYAPDDIFIWNKIFNSKKIVTLKGWESELWGRPSFVGTPELVIRGFNSNEFGNTEVSAGIRKLNVKGSDVSKIGNHVVTGTPDLKPKPFTSSDVGEPTVMNWSRTVKAASLRDTSLFGNTTVWLKHRWVKPEGFESELYGDQFISNFLRWLEPKGTPSSNKFGEHWASHAKRYIEPQGIFKEFEHLHRVGGDQFINLNEGIYGTAFGTRIIPERQYLYPLGIVPTFGVPTVNLNTRFINPRGINSGDGEGHEMFGQGHVFNSRQYIRQYFIKESGLVPPELNTTWTHIWNRNKKIGQIGTRFDKFGYHQIYNNARLIEPKGIAAPDITVSLVAYRVREVLPESIDKSFMGSWLVVWNSARPIGVSGIASKLKFGLPEVRNTRRYFPYITAGELTEFGLPMVAYRVRELTFDSRYTIAPPLIPLPEVKLQKRYVEPLSFEQARYGKPSLSIHWNKVTPRWTHQDYFGQPFVKNVTPEILMRGYHAAEYGHPTVFNSNQFLKLDGYGAQLFGRAKVEHRNKTIQVKGSNELRIGLHKVIKGASPPYGLQHITLEKIGYDGLPTEGYGIPKGDVGKPYMNQNVIYARGIPAPQAFGEALVQNNTITVDYGPFANMVGEPTVIVMRRYLKPESIKSETEVGKPRLSPHTIYAPTGAPPQAIANHPIGQTPLPVNAGVKFGNARVVNRHRAIRGYGVSHMLLGTPNVFLRTNYVFVNGIRSFRMGAVNVGDGVQTIKQFASSSFAAIGWHTVSRPIDTTQRIRVLGFDSLVIGKHWASKWIREIYPIGLNSQAMGSSRGEQSFYKPQSLHVGFPMPTIPQGFNAEIFGKHWVSLKVRNVEPKGFDMFIMEYDYTAFDKRMRVTRKNIPIATKQLIVAGIDGCTFGTPDVKLGVQYIRPDGNTDNFRKGVFK